MKIEEEHESLKLALEIIESERNANLNRQDEKESTNTKNWQLLNVSDIIGAQQIEAATYKNGNSVNYPDQRCISTIIKDDCIGILEPNCVDTTKLNYISPAAESNVK